MPRPAASIPAYRLHRPSGQAVVTLSGKDFYLGPHGSRASHQKYHRLTGEWQANGRLPPAVPEASAGLTLVELMAAYKRFARGYYRKHARVTNEYTQIVAAMKVAQKLYGREPASAFGPLKLQAVQQAMIAEKRWCRKHINKQCSRLVRMFRWAVTKELVPAGAAQALREVPGLHKGRTTARESNPVLPVADEVIERTLPHLPAIVAAMVRLQRTTGARPEEICRIRPCDIERSDEVWAYVPETHKTEHQGRRRTIFIGPRGQAILAPYLLRAETEYCFNPTQSEIQRRAAAHAVRKTPLNYGNRPGSNRRKRRERAPGERYTTESYRRAIHRVCNNRGIPRWSPNQLRHSAATEIRRRFGLEGAQVALGHAAADITQVYAERDLQKAAAIMRAIG